MWSSLSPSEYMKQIKDKEVPHTMAAQQNLQRLPVPPLQATVQKYLRSVEPLLSETEFENTKKATLDFVKQNGFGEELQKMLEEKDLAEKKSSKSWLEDWWLQFAYLMWPDPILINSNWYAVFKDHPLSVGQDVYQLNRATCLISNALKFRDLLSKGKLPSEKVRGNAICMDQYTRIFSTTRVPGLKQDHLSTCDPKESLHIIVMKKDQIFKVPVLDSQLNPLPDIQIYNSLKQVEIEADVMSDQPAVGIMTGTTRPEWAKLRESLMIKNAKNFEEIDKALFVVCLDEEKPTTRIEIARLCFHNYTGRNRWFDKSFSFVVFKNGRAGINAEHSPLDAPPLAHGLVLFATYAETEEQYIDLCEKIIEIQPKTLQSNISKVKWDISSSELDTITKTCESVKSFIKGFQLECLIYEDLGFEYLKKLKLSPDSFLQMAIQLAYYQIYKAFTATYESAQTRKFFHGRTETVRTLSNESKKFVLSMFDEKLSKSEKFQLLKKAIDHHVSYMNDASNGLGVDRHLLGLYILNLGSGKPLHPIFTDKAFTLSRTFKLSTSNLTPALSFFGGFGPVVGDGYGVCYALRPTQCWFSITCNVNSQQTDASLMYRSLSSSLKMLVDLCESQLISNNKL